MPRVETEITELQTQRSGPLAPVGRSVSETAIPLRTDDQRLGLDLNLPAGIEQPGDDDHRRCRADAGEQPSVFGADGISSSRGSVRSSACERPS